MLTLKKSFVAMSLVLLVIALGLFFGCNGEKEVTDTPSYTPTDTLVEETPTPSPTPSQFPIIDGPHAPSDLCQTLISLPITLTATESTTDREYIRGQAIITGSLSFIEYIILEEFGYVLGDMNPLILPLDGDNIIGRVETSRLGVSELEFVALFNQAVEALYPAVKNLYPNAAIAEPNYVIREPGGGPGTIGDPGDSGIMGDPVTLPSSVNTTADDFVNQWAFSGTNSIELEHIFDYGSKEYRADELWGYNVKILVFDSSPLATGSYEVRLGPDYPPYSLCVSALIFDTPRTTMTSDAWEVDSHGLFVANLAHAVAPDSFIHLVQVLQYDAEAEGDGIIRGDLFSLLNALYLYLEQDQTNLLTVVNLSLGFDIDEKDFEVINGNDPTSAELGDAIETVRAVLRSRGDSILLGIEQNPDIVDSDEYLPVASLQTLLSRYNERGVVFVAAAGNDGEILPQTPAIYPWVIGVGASNQEGGPSCFSNGGDVSAPGGDGTSWDDCVIDLETACSNDGNINNCSHGVMSVIMTDAAASYAYWAGTSFSTPQVSGMAAVALQRVQAPAGVQSLFCPDPSQIDGISDYLHLRGHFICGSATLADVMNAP